MKKLMMFAAAMTIVGGAFAQCVIQPDVECAMVYNVKMNLRTVSGKTTTVITGSASDCDLGTEAGCVRYPNFPYAVQGYLVTTDCDCTCDAISSAEAFLWAPRLKSTLAGEFDWAILHVLGKQNTAEAAWEFEGIDSVLGPMTLAGAGFGSYSKTAAYGVGAYSAFSGSVVGALEEPACIADCLFAAYWLCDDLGTALEDDAGIIYGTWAMKLNASASKAYSKGARIPVPAWYLY